MDLPAILALFDQKMRIEIEFPTARKEVFPDGALTPELVRHTLPQPRHNFVLYTRLEPDQADRVIQEQVAHFTTHFPKQSLAWNVYAHDEPADLQQRLQAHGFVPDDEPGTIMILDLESAPPPLLEPPRADVRPVTSPAELEDLVQVEQAVWGADFSWMRTRFGAEMQMPGYLNLYTAYADGQPACAAWIYFYPNNPFAGLYGGSTLAAYRGQGLYTALLAARVQEALRRKVRYLMVDAMPDSRPILERRGFQPITTSHPMILNRPEPA